MFIFLASAIFLQAACLVRAQPSSSSFLTLTSTSLPPSTSSSAPEPDLDNDTFETLQTQRVQRLIYENAASSQNATSWLDTQLPDGTWSDVDYTTGCNAQRANWPAEDHWQRILAMTSVWRSGSDNSTDMKNAISLAMDWWFERDFTNPACLQDGGTATCPCDDEQQSQLMWDPNWFSNVIGIPQLSSESCILMGNDSLSDTQLGNCTKFAARAYDVISQYTGANVLSIAILGIDMAIRTYNSSVVSDAYSRIHQQLQVENVVASDGIRADGSFAQHLGVLYNGNYGKDFMNAMLDLETEASGTSLSADDDERSAFALLVSGSKWMVVRNIVTGTLHWDLSVVGRFISFPVSDQQATGSLNLNTTEIRDLGQDWDSQVLVDFNDDLQSPSSNANAGNFTGNQMFYANDYMVHRGGNYVSTLKMFSNRTMNSECVNSENTFGFHLGDGTLYTYLTGDEYEDVAAAWDWNLIPGITTDYGATPLNCSTGGWAYKGKQAFVGGVSDGNVGIASMRYTNPATGSLSWQKSWFFLDDNIQMIMISDISSSTNASVVSVLDQRKVDGSVYIDAGSNSKSPSIEKHANSSYSGTIDEVNSLWHGGVGYIVDNASVSLDIGVKTGNWSTLGISTVINTVNLFAASIVHTNISTPTSYIALPGTSHQQFLKKKKTVQQKVKNVQNDDLISAVYDLQRKKFYVAFWDADGGVVKYNDRGINVKVSANQGGLVLWDLPSGNVTVADPSQTLSQMNITIQGFNGILPRTLSFTLPTGGIAGRSMSQSLF